MGLELTDIRQIKLHNITFDLGNVLLRVNWDKFWNDIIKLGLEKNKIHNIIELNSGLDFCGQLKLSDLFEKTEYTYNFHKELTESWNSIIEPDETMFKFIESLKYDGCKIAYLSNMGWDHLNYLNEKFPDFMKTAYNKHMSCEVGAMKPSNIYYQSFLLDNPEFAGCLYLDDIEANILAGSKQKFEGVLFNLNDFKSQYTLKKYLNDLRDKLLFGK